MAYHSRVFAASVSSACFVLSFFCGLLHCVSRRGSYAVVGGGSGNKIVDAGEYSVIAGGRRNNVSSTWSTISGGSDNFIGADASVVGGGTSNTCSTEAHYCAVLGGSDNQATQITPLWPVVDLTLCPRIMLPLEVAT